MLFPNTEMIVTSMQYLEPVYRGRNRGENFEYAHIAAREIKLDERIKLEEIAKKWTYVLGLIGHHRHSANGVHCRYRGVRNKVRFVERDGFTHIYVQGPYATEIGFEIEKLPFIQFSPSRGQVVTFSQESRESLVERVLDSPIRIEAQ